MLSKEERKIEFLKYKLEKLERKAKGLHLAGTHYNIHKHLPGRNEPCFCGSKIKFKKCCLSKIKKDLSSNEINVKFG